MRTLTLLLTALLPLGALAGCVDAPVEPSAAADDDAALENGAGLAATVTPVSKDGATPTGGSVCSVATPCQGQYFTGGEGSFELGFVGTLDAVDIVATWEAESPATEDMMIGIGVERDGEWTYEVESGPSPLTFTRDGLDIPAGSSVWLYMNAHKCTPTPVAPCVSTAQPFHLEGTFSTLPTA